VPDDVQRLPGPTSRRLTRIRLTHPPSAPRFDSAARCGQWPARDRPLIPRIMVTRGRAEPVTEPGNMTPKSQIDPAFVEKQRQYRLRRRASLVAAAEATEFDEAEVKGDRTGGALEFEEDAQQLDALERDGNLVVRDVERLERVDRALEKIEEGTYGLSDGSGEPIPREPLEGVPADPFTFGQRESPERKRSTA